MRVSAPQGAEAGSAEAGSAEVKEATVNTAGAVPVEVRAVSALGQLAAAEAAGKAGVEGSGDVSVVTLIALQSTWTGVCTSKE